MAYIVPIPLWVPMPPNNSYAHPSVTKSYLSQPALALLTPQEQQTLAKDEPGKDQPSILSPIESARTNLPPELARSRLTHPKSTEHDAPRPLPLPTKTILPPSPQPRHVAYSAPIIATRPEALRVHPPFGQGFQVSSVIAPGQSQFHAPPPPLNSPYYAYPPLCQIPGGQPEGAPSNAQVLGQVSLGAPSTIVHHLVHAAPPRAPVRFEYQHYPPPQLRALPNHPPQGSTANLRANNYSDYAGPIVAPQYHEASSTISRSSAGSITLPELDPSISSSSSSASPSPQNSPPKATIELPVKLNSHSNQNKSARQAKQASVAVLPLATKPNGGSGRVGKQPVRDPVKLMHRVWLQQNRVYQDKLRVAGFRVLEGVNGNKICSLCNKQFPKEMFVWRHALSHVDEKPFHCTVCDQKFTRSDTLQRHIRRAGHQSIAGNVM